MLTARTVAQLREPLRDARRTGRRIGLVPTMGALHAGHVSLLRRARAECDLVVMSLFVNPRQFDDAGDLAGYPRDEDRDLALAAGAGTDVVFIPAPEEVYPAGFATTVSVAGPALGLESAHRGSAHFDGVATVVSKLLLMAGPDVAYFGAKDAQQVAVVRRLATDLHLDAAIVVCPTVREPDGLAMSSRNARLSGAQRLRAAALYEALSAVRAAVTAGEREPGAITSSAHALLTDAGLVPEYLAIVDPDTMAPLQRVDRDALAVVAARIGAVRLIDNLSVSPPALDIQPQPVATPTHGANPGGIRVRNAPHHRP